MPPSPPPVTGSIFFCPRPPDATEGALWAHLLGEPPAGPPAFWQRELDRLDPATRADLGSLVADLRSGNLEGVFVNEDPRSPPELGRYAVMRGEVLATFNVQAGRNRLAVLHYPIHSPAA